MMHRMMGVLAAFGYCALAAPAWGQTPKLTIGYVPNAEFVPVFIAQEKGYFTKAGLDTTLTPIPIPSNVPAALTSRSIDVGPATAVNLLTTAENGLNLVAVSGYARNIVGKEPANIVVRSGVPYNSSRDLVGKRIGMAGVFSTFDVFFRIWLRNNNVAFDDVKEIDVNYPTMLNMLDNGLLDAAVVVDPFRTQIVNSGKGFIAADFIGEIAKDCVGLIWVANRDWATAHPAERAGFIAGLRDGIADVLQDRKGAEAVEAKYLKFSAPITDDFNLSLTPADLQFYQDFMLELGFIHQKINASELIIR